jgi:hypothetical protein
VEEMYDAMGVAEFRRLKQLEIEKARCKQPVDDKALEISIRREADESLGKPPAPRGGG